MQVFLQGVLADKQQTKQRTWEMGISVSLGEDTRPQSFFLQYSRIFNTSTEEAKPQQTQCGSLKKKKNPKEINSGSPHKISA